MNSLHVDGNQCQHKQHIFMKNNYIFQNKNKLGGK